LPLVASSLNTKLRKHGIGPTLNGGGCMGCIVGFWRAEMLVVDLWHATLLTSEKGLYPFAFLLALFGAIAAQKNTRDSPPPNKTLPQQ
jgi:hypothetical protein